MDIEKLIAEMMKHGHSRQTAEGAIAGRGLEAMWNEYMGGSSGGNVAGDFATQLIAAQKQQIEEETKYLKETFTDNPFAFDEALAKKSAKAEYEPYYTELLDDYLSEVGNKRQTIQGEKTLLADLYKIDASDKSREAERAITSAEEGWAGRGLFNSGMRASSTGNIMADYVSGNNRMETAISGQLKNYDLQNQALDIEEQKKRRDIGREQEASVEGGILQRKNEQIKAYYEPRLAAYYRKYPSQNNLLAGYVPADYLRY